METTNNFYAFKTKESTRTFLTTNLSIWLNEIDLTSLIDQTFISLILKLWYILLREFSFSSSTQFELTEIVLNIMSDLSDDEPVDRKEAAKIKHWKESQFAVGLVSVTWADDRIDCTKAQPNVNVDNNSNNMNLCSAYVCGCLGAGRVGNMVVLAQTTEEYDHHLFNEETGESSTVRRTRPKLLWVVRFVKILLCSHSVLSASKVNSETGIRAFVDIEC